MAKSTAQLDLDKIMACHGCDLLLEDIPVKPDEKLLCPRCGETLKAPKKDSVNRSLALSLTGLILFPFAMFMPVMTLDTMGLENSGNIVDGIITTWLLDHWFVAVILALTSCLFPLAKLTLLFIITLSLKLKRYPDYLRLLMRTYIHFDEWGMLEVYMIGILVTIIKIHHMANIHYDVGFFCFIGILGATLAASAIMDEEEFWNLIENGK